MALAEYPPFPGMIEPQALAGYRTRWSLAGCETVTATETRLTIRYVPYLWVEYVLAPDGRWERTRLVYSGPGSLFLDESGRLVPVS